MKNDPTPIPDLSRLIDEALPEDRGGLAIVFFHVDQEPGHPFEQMRGSFDGDYAPVIERSITAAHRVHPGAEIVMLTDETTPFDRSLPMRVIPLPMEHREWIMYERSRMQEAFARVWRGPALHLDTDICLNKRIDPLLNTALDIGVSYRPDMPYMPINGGWLLCRDPQKFAHFMADLHDIHRKLAEMSHWEPFDTRCFRGGQQALALLLRDKYPGRDACRVYPTKWGNVAVFSSDDVNRTFNPNDRRSPAFCDHFKGGAKMMLRAG